MNLTPDAPVPPQLEMAGRCAFRLMPDDDLADAPSAAVFTRLGSRALTLSYTWVHPTDGPQQGGLLVGASDEEGRTEGAWFDTWHQQPTLMHFTGRWDGERVELAGTYMEEWGWTVTLDLSAGDGHASMTMCNVVPESALAQLPADAPPMSAGPYDVMVASWSASSD